MQIQSRAEMCALVFLFRRNSRLFASVFPSLCCFARSAPLARRSLFTSRLFLCFILPLVRRRRLLIRHWPGTAYQQHRSLARRSHGIGNFFIGSDLSPNKIKMIEPRQRRNADGESESKREGDGKGEKMKRFEHRKWGKIALLKCQQSRSTRVKLLGA